MAQEVECLPSKSKALSSNTSTATKRKKETGSQWPTPVILATQEAEMRRIVV
jgi:hypothetical protein